MSKTNTAAAKKAEAAMKNLGANQEIATMLGAHRDGMMITDLNESVAKILMGVRRSGKKGALTIKLTFNPAKGDPSEFYLVDEIKETIPKPDVKASLMFIGGNNLPTFVDPSQLNLEDFTDTDDVTGEITEID